MIGSISPFRALVVVAHLAAWASLRRMIRAAYCMIGALLHTAVQSWLGLAETSRYALIQAQSARGHTIRKERQSKAEERAGVASLPVGNLSDIIDYGVA